MHLIEFPVWSSSITTELVVFSLCSWMTHCPGRLRPDKIEGSGVIDEEDGVEADVRPCGVDIEAGVRFDKVDDGVEDWRVEWMLKNDLVE